MSDDIFKDILEQIKKGNDRLAEMNTSLKDAVLAPPDEQQSTTKKETAKQKKEPVKNNRLLGNLADHSKRLIGQHPALAAIGGIGKEIGGGFKNALDVLQKSTTTKSDTDRGQESVAKKRKIGTDGASLTDIMAKKTKNLVPKELPAGITPKTKKPIDTIGSKPMGEAGIKGPQGATGVKPIGETAPVKVQMPKELPAGITKPKASPATAVKAGETAAKAVGTGATEALPLTEAAAGFGELAAALTLAVPGLGELAIVVAVVTAGLAAMAVAIVSITAKFIESQKELAKYNATLAVAYADAKVRQIQRAIKTGEETGGGTAALIGAFEDLKDAWAPISNALTNLATSILTPLVEGLTAITKVLSTVLVPIINAVTAAIRVVTAIIKVVMQPIVNLINKILAAIKPLLDAINYMADTINNWFGPGKAKPASIMPGEQMFQEFSKGKMPRDPAWKKRELLPPKK